MMMLLAIWLMSIQALWAQSLSLQDLKETCDFTKGTISYTLPTEKLPENSTCTWTVKVGDKEVTDGKTLSDDTRTLTLPLGQEIRSVEVSYTDANQTAQTFSFTITPKVYGKEYNGVKFYADAYDGGDGSKDTPFIIKTDLQLAKLAREVTDGKSSTMPALSQESMPSFLPTSISMVHKWLPAPAQNVQEVVSSLFIQRITSRTCQMPIFKPCITQQLAREQVHQTIIWV